MAQYTLEHCSLVGQLDGKLETGWEGKVGKVVCKVVGHMHGKVG